MLRIVALLACVLASTALAQDLRWNLPDRGAARYERMLRDEAKVEPEGAWDSRPWSGPAPAAVVLDGELDAKKKRSQEPLNDLRDLLPRLCLDLSHTKPGKVKLELRSVEVGVDVEATYAAVADDGSQQIEATFVDWNQKELGAQRAHRPLVKGSLRGTRVLDRENGRVARFDGELAIEAKWFDKPRTVRCTVRDEWTFVEVLAPQDAKVRALVADAIRKATESLEKNLQRLCDQNAPQGHDPYHDHQPGELALALLAILKGGGDPKSDAVQKAYDNLRRRNIEGTYSLGAAILAIEALYTPIGEWQSLREGTIDAPMARNLSAEDLAIVKEWTKRLLDNLDTTTDPAYVRRYHYGADAGEAAPAWPHHLTGISLAAPAAVRTEGEASERRLSTYAYDRAGRAVMSVRGTPRNLDDSGQPRPGTGIEQVDLEFAASDRTVLTNSLGQRTTYRHTRIHGEPRLQEAIGTGCARCVAVCPFDAVHTLRRGPK